LGYTPDDALMLADGSGPGNEDAGPARGSRTLPVARREEIARRLGVLAGAGILLAAAAGCGTLRDAAALHASAFDEPGPHVYGGLRLDAVEGWGEWNGHLPLLSLFYWLGLPLDVVLDTVLLPWTAVRSLDPEGRDYVTLGRVELDQTVARDEKAERPGEFLYLGSEDGYHRLRLHHASWAERQYRVPEGELRIKDPFPYARGSRHAVTLKTSRDPWPLPEPIWAAYNFVVVDRVGLDGAIRRDLASTRPGSLLYLGSESGYHHLKLAHAAYSSEREYRVPEGGLKVKKVFPYAAHSGQRVTLKRPEDPWPLPEPLEARTE
jgi:uncharacterized protein YceK